MALGSVTALLACSPTTSETGGSSESTGTDTTDSTTISSTSVTASTTVSTTDTTTTASTTASTTDGTSTTDPTDPTGDTGSSDDGPTTGTTTSDGSSSSDDGGSSSEDTGEPANLDDWTQRRQVFIDNANEVELTDHEIAIDLEIDDEMNGDLSDLRFTDSDGNELLPHWLETQIPSVSFRAWVRVPFVPAEDVGVIYMWYGNEGAEDVSDPAATFHFWEPFDGEELADIWTSNGEYEVANGRLTVTNGSVYTVDPLVDAPGWILDARMSWPNDDFNDAGAGLSMGTVPGVMPGISYVRVFRGSEGFQIDAAVDGIGVPGGGDNPPLPFQATTMEWLRIGNGPDLARGGWTHVPPPPSNNIDMPAVIDEEMYVWFGEIGGTGVVNPGDCYDVEIDTLLIRRFEELQPAISRGPEEDV